MVWFAALDVETANPSRGSICQISVVRYDGELLRDTLLLDPREPFAPVQSSIHGISAAMVRGAPTFAEIHGHLASVIGERPIVSYTAFDRQAVAEACARVGKPMLGGLWLDACALARDAWPDRASHKLRDIGAMLGIPFQKNHEAERDALAAAYVFLKGVRLLGISEAQARRLYAIDEPLVTTPFSEPRRVFGAPTPPGPMANVLLNARGLPSVLTGQTIVITGDCPFNREDMKERIAALGGRCVGAVSSKTTLLVSGWDVPEDGGDKIRKAADLILEGRPLMYCTAQEFSDFVTELERVSEK